MKKLDIPKGNYSTLNNQNGQIAIHNGAVAIYFIPEKADHCYDSKLLALDTLETYQECGKTPSELLKQNKELLDALKRSEQLLNEVYNHIPYSTLNERIKNVICISAEAIKQTQS